MTAAIDAPSQTVRVRDIADSIQYGHTASAVNRPTGPRFLRITDIQDGQVAWSSVPSCDIDQRDVAKYSLRPGDLVFARTGATTGKSYLIGECPEAIFASYLIRVRVTEDAIDPRYLAAFFQSPDYWQQIEGGKRGIGQPNVNATILGDIILPLPSLEEQRAIVEEIDTQLSRLEAGVAGLRRAQASLKRYRAATLKAACEGRLVPTEAELAHAEGRDYETGAQLLAQIVDERRRIYEGKRKYREPLEYKAKVENLLPDGWETASVDKVASVEIGFAFKSAEFESSGVRLLRGENIEPGALRWTDTKHWPENKIDEFKHLLLREKDIILAMDRPVISSGFKIARVREDDLPCLLVQRVARLRPTLAEEKSAEILSDYLFIVFQTKPFINHIQGGQTGTQLPHVSGTSIQNYGLPLPPLAEQARIVAEVERRLSVVDSLEAAVRANLHRATRLRQSVLQKAFGRTSIDVAF